MSNIDILEEACEKLPHSTRAMFGGHGLFAPNGGMFAGIVTDDEIVLKLAEPTARGELIALGGHPWVYNGKMTMNDWIVIPERFYDEPAELAAWAKRAHALAPPKKAKAAKGARVAKGAKGPPKQAARKAPAKKAAAKKAPAKKRARG